MAMCKALEDMRTEVAREAAREAIERNSIETALRLIAQGKLTLEEIAEGTSLPIETIQELAKQKTS
ncbi:MAG: hypothetical protein IJK38_11620 [Oscillospiraceae bacterium]|nr:hypothetical protein [Oscillospiraceae bacterium]